MTSGPLARLCTRTSILPKSFSTFLATSDTVKPRSPAAAYLLLLLTCRHMAHIHCMVTPLQSTGIHGLALLFMKCIHWGG